MSDTNQKPPIVSKWIAGLGCGTILLLILGILAIPFSGVPIEIVVRLITGWIHFTGRVLPQISWDFVMITSGLIALLIAAWGFHWLASRFRPDWRKSWTTAWILLGGLLFTASIFTMGMAHQTAWLFRDPIVISRTPFSNMRQLLLGLRLYISENESLPDRLYDLYPEYIDAPFEEEIWKFKSANGVAQEILYFPEVFQLSKSESEDDLIVIAAPPLSGKSYVGFLGGSVRKIPEIKFHETLAAQQEKVFEMLKRLKNNP